MEAFEISVEEKVCRSENEDIFTEYLNINIPSTEHYEYDIKGGIEPFQYQGKFDEVDTNTLDHYVEV